MHTLNCSNQTLRCLNLMMHQPIKTTKCSSDDYKHRYVLHIFKHHSFLNITPRYYYWQKVSLMLKHNNLHLSILDPAILAIIMASYKSKYKSPYSQHIWKPISAKQDIYNNG